MLHERNGTSSPRPPRTSSRSQRVIIFILYGPRNLTIIRPALQSSTPLPGALRDLYRNMSRTTDSIVPSSFLQVLRQVRFFLLLTDRCLIFNKRSIHNLRKRTVLETI
jgi:hypothetical protein